MMSQRTESARDGPSVAETTYLLSCWRGKQRPVVAEVVDVETGYSRRITRPSRSPHSCNRSNAFKSKPRRRIDVISRARGRLGLGTLAALLWAIPAAAANQLPIANAGPDKSGVAGATITFDARGSSDPDGTVAAYWWQFGDGSAVTVGTGTVGHVYAAAGTYSATLWVRDAAGAWSATSDMARATITTGTALTTTTTTTTRPATTTTLSSTNKLPIADAGPNQATQTLITLTFNGSGSRDP